MLRLSWLLALSSAVQTPQIAAGQTASKISDWAAVGPDASASQAAAAVLDIKQRYWPSDRLALPLLGSPYVYGSEYLNPSLTLHEARSTEHPEKQIMLSCNCTSLAPSMGF